ncbi:MAG TPA: mechanosensitive ion channel domain-containing protein [Pirellulales bacterium]
MTTIWESVAATILLFLPRIVGGAVVLLVFWGLGRLAFRLIVRLPKLEARAPELTHLMARTVKLCLELFGVVTALGTLGIEVSALVAGLGLTGFAFGFALKDIISNALSGVLIIFFRPFKQGDRISVFSSLAFEGTVVEINLRYTVLDAEEKTVFIPNSILFTNAVSVRKQPSAAAS